MSPLSGLSPRGVLSPRGGNFLSPDLVGLSGFSEVVVEASAGFLGALLTISKRLCGCLGLTISTRGVATFFTGSTFFSSFFISTFSTTGFSAGFAFLTTKAFGFLCSFTPPDAINSLSLFTCSIVTVLE